MILAAILDLSLEISETMEVCLHRVEVILKDFSCFLALYKLRTEREKNFNFVHQRGQKILLSVDNHAHFRFTHILDFNVIKDFSLKQWKKTI